MLYKNMEQIKSDMLEQVLNLTKDYDYNLYTKNDVQKTLNKEILNIEDLKVLLYHIKAFENNNLLKCKYTSLYEKKCLLNQFLNAGYEIIEI